MSLRFAGTSGQANLNGAAALGNTTSGTILGWWRKEDSTVDRDILQLSRSGGGAVIRVGAAGQIKGGFNQNVAGFGTFNVSTNAYVGLALTISDSVVQFYAYDGSSLTLVATDTSFYAPTNLNNCYFGNTGAWGAAAVGCHRYGRYWSRVLSSAEILAEFQMIPSPGTPAASTTNLRGSWLFPDATTNTDVSGVGNNLTIANGSTSSDEPTIGGSASPAIVSVRQSPARPLGLGSFGVKVI